MADEFYPGPRGAVTATIAAAVEVPHEIWERLIKLERRRDVRMAGRIRWASKMVIFLSLGLSGCSSAGPARPAVPETPEIARLDGTTIDPAAVTARIEELTRAAQVQGLTVTVFNDAKMVYSRAFGFGNLPAGQTLRMDTEFYGASLSKAVFAVLVMKLIEQGVVDLDKPLQDYLDEPLWAKDTFRTTTTPLRDRPDDSRIRPCQSSPSSLVS